MRQCFPLLGLSIEIKFCLHSKQLLLLSEAGPEQFKQLSWQGLYIFVILSR